MYDILPVTNDRDTVCGAACLKMLLAYYGEDEDISTLIDELHITVSGCSMKDIIQVGMAHGLDPKSYQMDAEEVIKQDRPSIVWWMYNHFIVCCGQDDAGKVVVCNPSRGRYRMSKELFASFYAGVALFNGEPQDLPVSDTATAEDYEHALGELGVNV